MHVLLSFLLFAPLACIFLSFETLAIEMDDPSSSSLPPDTSHIVADEDTDWGRAVERKDLSARQKTCHDPAVSEIQNVDVAIIGGGLAGIAVGIGLSREVPDVTFKVYEKAPQLRSVSQGILSITDNGMRALKQIHPDLPSLIKEAGVAWRVLQSTMIEANGTTTDTIRDMQDIFGVPALTGITWNKLQAVLASLLSPNHIAGGHSFHSFVEEDDSILIYFENGAIVRAKALIACDGVFSIARHQMFNNQNDSPIYFGQSNWGSIIETSKLPTTPDKFLHPPNAIRSITSQGEPRWHSFLNDAGGGFTFWQLRVSDPEKAMALSGNNGRGGLGLSGVKDAILPVARGLDDLATVIQHTPESQIFERSIVGRYPLPTWRSKGGKAVLVGDSAHGMHPSIGQGANSAFESVAAVVQAMVKHQRDGKIEGFATAFADFEAVRKPRADIVHKYANAAGVRMMTSNNTQILSDTLQREMSDWLKNGDANMESKPPAAAVEALESFDPCDSPGVSRLW
jgi:salicylate hydroxylase